MQNSPSKSSANRPEPVTERTWQVLLIGGASGAGKTSVSYPLAQHFNVGITEIDDIHLAIQRMTTPEQQPEIHFWRTRPDVNSLPAEEIVRHFIEECRAMIPALEAVIGNHLQTNTPVILDGDYILPALAAQESFCDQRGNGRVRMVIIDEDDEDQLKKNFLAREGKHQALRAEVSRLHGSWLKQEAEVSGVAVIPSRPWNSLLLRVVQALT